MLPLWLVLCNSSDLPVDWSVRTCQEPKSPAYLTSGFVENQDNCRKNKSQFSCLFSSQKCHQINTLNFPAALSHSCCLLVIWERPDVYYCPCLSQNKLEQDWNVFSAVSPGKGRFTAVTTLLLEYEASRAGVTTDVKFPSPYSAYLSAVKICTKF